MMTRNYKIANCIVEINSLYNTVHEYCKDYLTDASPDFSVTITSEDIVFEKRKSDSEYAYEGLALPDFSEGVLEETAVYRKIAEKMVLYDRIVFHGSVIAVDCVGYLFTAKSGTGKSTHTRLWRNLFGERAVMVNDDKPLIHITDNGVTAYGTPWNGKHHLGKNISVPLKAICILTRAEENHIEKISRVQAYSMLLQQVYRPRDAVKMQKTLLLIDKMEEQVEFYKLGCNMDISAVETAYNAMKG